MFLGENTQFLLSSLLVFFSSQTPISKSFHLPVLNNWVKKMVSKGF